MLTKKTRVPAKKKATRKAAANPRKQPSQERSRETVAVILEAAARILESRGLEGYNTNAVAEKAGVSIGSLYQYFPGKDALTIALIRSFEDELLQSVKAAIAASQHDRLTQALQRIVRALYATHIHRAALNVVLEAEEQRLQQHIPENKETLTSLVTALLKRHRQHLRLPMKEAVQDTITISRAMVDAALREGLSAATAERRTVRALTAYLFWQDQPNESH
ncbi:TetR/AcrR family transcriptional regulator [Terriglobus roseus]|uniref:Transcriptional regulator, TetR family n=1 Tax=Terriglobus roseus TaxID=392734 RepID=A0A1G7MM40_9BACT|nr:TetR/AcrR family transcriptional regulator [Terriglobus roseus]SDF62812.1 transcriptional regulator, TetR family [Terriglobus roseus]